MLLKSDSSAASVGYEGSSARIASVHQFGAVDAVADGGPMVRYPERPLLGVSTADRAWVQARLLDHLSGHSYRAKPNRVASK